jgi:NTP pyrophosphatase (non-canonical NTP hydrolase)
MMEVKIKELEEYLYENYGKSGDDQGLFMKLIEEIGEVAEVLNKRSGRKDSAENNLQIQLANELADVIHYAVAIAAVNHIDLNDVILSKDKKAAIKYNHKRNLENFILSRNK